MDSVKLIDSPRRILQLENSLQTVLIIIKLPQDVKLSSTAKQYHTVLVITRIIIIPETFTAPVYISSSDAALLEQSKRQAASDTSGTRKKPRNILIGIHVTEEERAELRKTFCSNGFSLATAYRAAMAYLQQDIEYGKAYLTANGEIRRRQ